MCVAPDPGSRASIHAAERGARQPLVALSVAPALTSCLVSRDHLGRNANADLTWDHVHLRTPDPEAMAQWFERVFGAEIIRSTQLGQTRLAMKLAAAV